MSWAVLLLLMVFEVECKIKHSGVFTECSRGHCDQLSDREVGWEFDQPEPFYVEKEEGGDIRTQLELERHLLEWVNILCIIANNFCVLVSLVRHLMRWTSKCP